jgi:hypothetical protein
MEQSPPWEANSTLSWTPERSVPCSQEPATGPYLNYMNPIHSPKSYFPKIHFNIIRPSAPSFSESSLHFGLLNQNFVRISLLPYACYMPLPSHPSRLFIILINYSHKTKKIIFGGHYFSLYRVIQYYKYDAGSIKDIGGLHAARAVSFENPWNMYLQPGLIFHAR